MEGPRLIATAVGSLVVGLVVGYKVAEKRLAAQFEERLQKETAGMREFYQHAKKPFATPQEAAAALIQEPEAEVPEEGAAKEANNKVAYHKIVKKEYATETPEMPVDEELEKASVGPPPVDHNLFNEHPHIITQEEFMQNDSGYIQGTLTYYEGDGVLTDERDDVIEDLDDTVGQENMTKFGINSSDPHVVHIRNGRLQMEFEVTHSESSYRLEVLGIEENPPELPSGRAR